MGIAAGTEASGTGPFLERRVSPISPDVVICKIRLPRHAEIKTTLPKAKELRRVVEPMITLGKAPSLANRRLAFDRLRDRAIVGKLFDELGPRYAKRNGGYLRILKSGVRKGDNAPMALVTLLDRPEPKAQEKKPAQEKKAA